MIDQTITTPPPAPSSNDIPSFKARFDAFLAWMVVFVSQLVTLVSQINSTATTVNNDATTASNAKDSAVASANFLGTWSIVTAYTVGQSVYYNGIIYRSLQAGTNKQPDTQTAYWASIATASDALLSLINQKADTTDVNTALGDKADKATSLSGYGITNAYTKTETDAFFNKPCFSATRLNATQALSTGVLTKVQLKDEEFDLTNSFDSITNYRFQPTVAGYYQMDWGVVFDGTHTLGYAQLYKNGAGFKFGNINLMASNTNTTSSGGSAIVYMNGTTDYLELYAYAVGSSLVIALSSNPLTYLSGHFIRN